MTNKSIQAKCLQIQKTCDILQSIPLKNLNARQSAALNIIIEEELNKIKVLEEKLTAQHEKQ